MSEKKVIQKAPLYNTKKMRPQIGKQKVYENAIKIVQNFVRVCSSQVLGRSAGSFFRSAAANRA